MTHTLYAQNEAVATALKTLLPPPHPQLQHQAPIQFKDIVIKPVLVKSTNMAPIIGTIKKGFTE